MLTYNTHLPQLVLPQYGRNIQQMVDHCTDIADRDERNRCAKTIVDAMLTLFPANGNREEHYRKLWDHLIIMSRFKLAIDLPFEPLDPTVFADRPEPLTLPQGMPMYFRHYGSCITRLVDIICTMPEGHERDELTLLTANQMKKMFLNINRDGADDSRIFDDLRNMSHGSIRLDPASTVLNDYRPTPLQAGKKKKKK